MHRIKYAALCHRGYVRNKNQDNLWCNGQFLNSENEGLPEMLSGEAGSSAFPAFAVFDGMGGEQRGEMAAYIAASHFDRLFREKNGSNSKGFLLDACAEINNQICSYQRNNHIRQMGTTAAIAMFGNDGVCICNIGDSRIYHHSGQKMAQISCDHSETSMADKKPLLTQNLGIPETEFVIEPYVAKGLYSDGDRYLLCSDGLTDMVPDEDILKVFERKSEVSETAQGLMDMALSNGGIDNITVIVCEIHKRRGAVKWV